MTPKIWYALCVIWIGQILFMGSGGFAWLVAEPPQQVDITGLQGPCAVHLLEGT